MTLYHYIIGLGVWTLLLSEEPRRRVSIYNATHAASDAYINHEPAVHVDRGYRLGVHPLECFSYVECGLEWWGIGFPASAIELSIITEPITENMPDVKNVNITGPLSHGGVKTTPWGWPF